ncbi:hypothetical protein B0H34DRAFT_739431 [Crassisporium funariophilum]|nr:hypothetical protein B0H34DRAFT_739431 [Crassisporium funariophilum]
MVVIQNSNTMLMHSIAQPTQAPYIGGYQDNLPNVSTFNKRWAMFDCEPVIAVL